MSQDLQVQTILEKNKVDDLNRFLEKRKCLNESNNAFVYIFHILQSAGVIVTSVSTGLGYQGYAWIGIVLNMCASLVSVIQQTNDGISKRLLTNIQSIHDGSYIDEDTIVDVPNKELSK
jgi:hypothetical protein